MISSTFYGESSIRWLEVVSILYKHSKRYQPRHFTFNRPRRWWNSVGRYSNLWNWESHACYKKRTCSKISWMRSGTILPYRCYFSAIWPISATTSPSCPQFQRSTQWNRSSSRLYSDCTEPSLCLRTFSTCSSSPCCYRPKSPHTSKRRNTSSPECYNFYRTISKTSSTCPPLPITKCKLSWVYSPTALPNLNSLTWLKNNQKGL